MTEPFEAQGKLKVRPPKENALAAIAPGESRSLGFARDDIGGWARLNVPLKTAAT